MVARARNVSLRVVPPVAAVQRQKALRQVSLPPGIDPYYRRIETFAERIRNTDNVPEIIGILDEALRETRGLSHFGELKLAIKRIEQAEREISQLKSELENAVTLVQIDQLTQVLNRRGLDESFARESARSNRHGAPLCLAMIDIDNFKLINDTYGHPAGDAALVHLAKTLRTTLRPIDVIARYGGEEFVALLPESDDEAALVALSRVQRALNDAQPAAGVKSPTMTFSAGIALHSRGESQTQMIARADAALLEAKRAGKDRVFLANG